jgi:hypothetical protein
MTSDFTPPSPTTSSRVVLISLGSYRTCGDLPIAIIGTTNASMSTPMRPSGSRNCIVVGLISGSPGVIQFLDAVRQSSQIASGNIKNRSRHKRRRRVDSRMRPTSSAPAMTSAPPMSARSPSTPRPVLRAE